MYRLVFYFYLATNEQNVNMPAMLQPESLPLFSRGCMRRRYPSLLVSLLAVVVVTRAELVSLANKTFILWSLQLEAIQYYWQS